MEFRGYMESSDDIIARIKQLDETLGWDSSLAGTDGTVHLVSAQSKRVISAVRLKGTMFQVCTTDYDGNLKGTPLFTELAGAKAYAKFTALRDLLSEDLRRAHVQ